MTDPQTYKPAQVAAAAGAIFTDSSGRTLLVKPVYRATWDIAGGHVDPGETPHEACIREVAEELGIFPQIGRLLVIDWSPNDDGFDKVIFIFDGGELTLEQINSIKVQDSELSEYRYVATEIAQNLATPRVMRRIVAAARARSRHEVIYLESGQPIA